MTGVSTTGVVVAGIQFPVVGDVRVNGAHIERGMRAAKAQGAALVLTPETALTGYAWSDVTTWEGYDWETLREETARLQGVARALELWLLLGTTHFVDEGTRPMNAVYVIDPRGEIVDRYDKSMLTDPDQLMYSAGDHPVVVEIGGVKMGVLVCYDVCYPEMVARYRDMGCSVVLHAFYNAGFDGPNILDEVKPAWIRVRAADNQIHVVAVNSSRAHASWGSRVARPDGSIADEIDRHAVGLVCHAFPDDTLVGWLHNKKPMRLAVDEVYARGETASAHPRVKDRRAPP